MSKSSQVTKTFGDIVFDTTDVFLYNGGGLTLSALDSGKTYITKDTTGSVIQLPKTSPFPFVNYTFIAGVNATNTQILCDSANNLNNVHGVISCATTAGNVRISGADGLNFTTNSVKGDQITITSDSSTYYVNGVSYLSNSFTTV